MTTAARCKVFAWIGQTFASCDDCGKPYWEHPYEAAVGIGSPFGEETARRPITPEMAEAVEAKWGRGAGTPYRWKVEP